MPKSNTFQIGYSVSCYKYKSWLNMIENLCLKFDTFHST